MDWLDGLREMWRKERGILIGLSLMVILPAIYVLWELLKWVGLVK